MIYFIRQNEQVKIGTTNNIKARLGSLQVASPYDLSVLLLIDGDLTTESELHKKFVNDRIRGEWYTLSDDIKKYIASKYNLDMRYQYGLLDPGGIDPAVQTKLVRNLKGLTLREVGELLNLTAQSVRETETRELHGTVSINVLRKYAEALGYELQYKFVSTEVDENLK